MTGLGRDVTHGWRALAARPGTSILATLALALGIGLTTTMFSIVQGAILRGLPFEQSDRIMYLGRATTGRPDSLDSAPMDDFIDWRRQQTSFDDLAAYSTMSVVVSGGLAPERYRAARFSDNVLSALRVTPVAGRGLSADDCRPGAPAVALIAYRVWADQFHSDPATVGQLVRINGTPTTIVGVLPPKFGFPQAQDLWLPLEVKPQPKRGQGTFVDVIGRLRPGVSIAQARAGITAIAAGLERQYPENKGVLARVEPYIRRGIGKSVINTLFSMLGAVFGVMLIACANVTTLQLARAAERAREIAVRTALGAGRWRIVRELLVEGLMLSAAGAALGLLLAAAGVAAFNRQIVDTNPPFWIDIRIDTTVLAFVTLIAVVAALASSLVPALRATRQDVNAALKDEGRSNTGLRMGRFSRMLVIAEVLLSCMLLFVSGLMIKGVAQLAMIEYPFATSNIFTAGVGYDDRKYSTEAAQAALAKSIEERLSREPGLVRVAISNGVPTPGGGTPFSIEGKTYQSDGEHPQARLISATPSYFDVLGVKILRGRAFTSGDTPESMRVVVVGEDFAQRHFPGADPLGRRIQLGLQTSTPWYTIIGVVPALAVAPNAGDVTEYVFRAIAQAPRGINLMAATAGDPLRFTTTIRKALLDVDPDLAVFTPNSLSASLTQRNWAIRVFGVLFMCFGAGALVLAAAGLYGVMAFGVRTRRQEIGVRMALGADRGKILRMILWQGMWRVMIGIALGLAPAWQLGKLMTALLFRVTPTDPAVFAVTIGVLLAAGFAASTIPALRAASVDPLDALRHG
jgi:predicted permease